MEIVLGLFLGLIKIRRLSSPMLRNGWETSYYTIDTGETQLLRSFFLFIPSCSITGGRDIFNSVARFAPINTKANNNQHPQKRNSKELEDCGTIGHAI